MSWWTVDESLYEVNNTSLQYHNTVQLYPENHPGMEHVFSYNFEFLFDDYCTIIVKIRWPMFWLHNSPGNGVVSSSLVRAVGVASHAVALHAFAHAHVGTAD